MDLTTRTLLLALLAFRSFDCWPDGAPFKTCINRFPKHGGQNQQQTPSPYVISINQTTYRPSQVLQVTLTSTTRTAFRGFQIGARLSTSSSGEDNDVIVGEWISHDERTTRLQYWYPQKSGTKNCATHLNNNDKEEIVLHWRAPSENVGNIVFRSGFVKDFDTFWSDVQSGEIISELGSVSKPPVTFRPPSEIRFSTSECGRSKGCFLYPHNCVGDNCLFGVTYEALKRNDSVRFELIGRADGYVSFAVSEDDHMGEDETITCVSTGSRNLIQHGYNPERRNDQHHSVDLSDKIVAKIDGRIVCSFVRPISASLTYIQENRDKNYADVTDHLKTFDLANHFYIQMAWGEVYKGSSVLKKHAEIPLVSPRKVDMLNNDVVFGVGLPVYLKAHAILAYFAWIFLTGCAMILARHYRQILSMKFLGIALWFQLHRGAMFAAAVITAVVIIIMFASLGEWSVTATNHAILGLTTLTASIVQVIFGILRPGLDSSRRPLFNYFHRFLAVTSQTLAVATLILGARLELVPVDLRYTLTVIIVVSVAGLLLFEILLESIRLFVNIRTAAYTTRVDDNQLQMERDKKASPSVSMDPLKSFLLAVFALTALASFVVFSAYVGIA